MAASMDEEKKARIISGVTKQKEQERKLIK